MATKKKMLEAAAGGAGGAGLDIDEVFSTYLYTGTGSALTITNGIDLDGEGGLAWFKMRNAGFGHRLVDTERGVTKKLESYNTAAEGTEAQGLTAFNSNGFTVGSHDNYNANTYDFASWTFRKAPKFFDCVTWTGTGSTQTIAHNLSSNVGFLLIKCTNTTGGWMAYHREGLSGTSWGFRRLDLDLSFFDPAGFPTYVGDGTSFIAPTSTEFVVNSNSAVNASGNTYVAYLFAHNNGDGEFGPDSDQDIIKCGSYVGNTSTKPVIDLGFEPQWLMIKSSTAGTTDDAWYIVDNMRSFEALPLHDDGSQFLRANATDAESGAGQFQRVASNSTGFSLGSGTGWNAAGQTYIYMAIRRGPLAPPEAGTEVFEVFETTNTGTASTIGSMGPSDFILNKRTDAAATWRTLDRLRGGSMLRTDSTDSESGGGFLEWDKMGGVFVTATGAPYITNDAQAHWSWKRAPSYFDCVAYSGNSTAGRTVSHNLGVAPEMMWVKSRSNLSHWQVYHSGIGATKYLELNNTGVASTNSARWNDTTPGSSTFTLGNDDSVNVSGRTYIAYLFASLDGVSKVGSYTGSNSVAVEVNCGFTSGARFVLIKRTDAVGTSGNWYVYDSVRGIVSAADDPYLLLNTADAEASNTNNIEPLSSGFKLTIQGNNPISVNGGSYVFYAIA